MPRTTTVSPTSAPTIDLASQSSPLTWTCPSGCKGDTTSACMPIIASAPVFGRQRRASRRPQTTSPTSATIPAPRTRSFQGHGTNRAITIATIRTMASKSTSAARSTHRPIGTNSAGHPIWGMQLRRRAEILAHVDTHDERTDRMAELIAIGYPDETTAGEAEKEAHHLADELIIQPDAIASIARDKDCKFRVSTRHSADGAGASYGMSGAFTFGLLSFGPV